MDAGQVGEKRGTRCGAVAMVVAATLVIAGCGSLDPDSGAGSERPTLRIVTYSSFVLDDAVKADIEAELGADIEIRAAGDAGESLAKAILAAGNPEGDVFFGVDNTLLSRALEGGVFQTPEGSDTPAWARVEGTDAVVAINWGAVCVDYDRDWLAVRGIAPPRDLADLLDGRFADLLVVPDPAASSPGLVFLSAINTVVEDPRSYLQALRDNGVAVAGSWDDAWFEQYTVNGGDRPLVVSYASSPPAEVFFSEGDLDRPATAVAEGTCARQVEMAGVMAGTEQPELASRLLAAMLRAPWQESLPLTNFVEPLRPGARRPELFERFAPIPEDIIELPPAAVGSQRDDWIDTWREIMG